MSVLKPRLALYRLTGYWRISKPRKLTPACPHSGSRVWTIRVLLSVQFESHPLQPFFGQALTVLDDGSVPVEDHEIIPISDDLGFPAHLDALPRLATAGFSGELGAEVRFEAVQGDVGQQR